MIKCFCNHEQTDHSFSILCKNRSYTYSRCSACKTYRMIDSPKLDEIIQHYNSEKSARLAPDFKAGRARTVIEDLIQLESYHSYNTLINKNLLDIGCSEGAFVEEAQRKGYTATGIDIAIDLIEYGKSKGCNLVNADYLQTDFHNLDIITMHDSLEHVYAPDAYLTKAYNDLNSKGVLQITFPSYIFAKNVRTWEHSRIDHNWLFSIQGLIDFLKNLNFSNFKVLNNSHAAYPGCVMIICYKGDKKNESPTNYPRTIKKRPHFRKMDQQLFQKLGK